MSIEITCDNCGKRNIGRSYTGQRLTTKVGRIQTETIVAVDDRWNGGHLCYECLVGHLQVAISAGENSGAQPPAGRSVYPEGVTDHA